MTKVLKLFAVFALLLGLTAPAMAEEAKPTKAEAEKGHVHKDGDGHKDDKKIRKTMTIKTETVTTTMRRSRTRL